MVKTELTPKQEQFCRHLAVGCSQSDAYRKAFKPKKAKASSIHCNASKVMALTKVQQRIKELSAPLVENVRKTREDVLDLLQAIGWHDKGKMYDAHGNPIELPDLPYAERMAIDGFEFCEDFIGRRDGEDGEDKRVACGYTKKFKGVDRHKYLSLYCKMMGFIDSDDDDPSAKAEKSIQVTFVSAKGQNVQVNVSNSPRSSSAGPPHVGVKFVK